jgi:amidase
MLLPDDPARAFLPYPAAEVPQAPSGPLSGLTCGVKDLFDVAGYPTGGGSPHLLAMSGTKTRTAPAVQRVLDAGARFVGKTHTDELAFSLNGKNAHFGTPVNGGAPDRIPGGSSSGSASAVSNGLCDFAFGSDTGGSVRGPASHCGLFGIRPTHGRVSLEGALFLAPSFDTCGFFARDAATFERVAAVVLGDDPAPLPERPRLLLAADAFAMLDMEVRGVHAPIIQRIEEKLGRAELVEAAPGGFEPFYWAFSKGVTDQQVADSRAVRERARRALAELLGADGVMLLPTMPDVAPLLGEGEEALEDYRTKALNLLCLSGLSGLPQISMPLARRLEAPLGLSIMGPAGSDLSLVRLAARIAAG